SHPTGLSITGASRWHPEAVTRAGMSKGGTIRLSKMSVDALPTTGKRYWVFDSDLSGFAVRVQKTGSKTFAVFYRPGGGRSSTKRNMTLGTFGKITVEEARREAKLVLGK